MRAIWSDNAYVHRARNARLTAGVRFQMMTEQDREYVGSVALVVLGDALDPDEVSRSLQLTPSQCWRKGEKSLRLADGTIRVRDSEYEWGGWKLLVAGERKDSPIESQLEYWVDLLRSRTAALKRLRVLGYECALDVFVTSSGAASIVVPHQLQKEIAALAVDIHLSFFADSEPER